MLLLCAAARDSGKIAVVSEPLTGQAAKRFAEQAQRTDVDEQNKAVCKVHEKEDRADVGKAPGDNQRENQPLEHHTDFFLPEHRNGLYLHRLNHTNERTQTKQYQADCAAILPNNAKDTAERRSRERRAVAACRPRAGEKNQKTSQCADDNRVDEGFHDSPHSLLRRMVNGLCL